MPDVTEQQEVVDTPTPNEVVDTSVEEAQPVEDDSYVSEDDENSEDDSSRRKGDLSQALRQEREMRRKYEQALTDPNFIYEQAKKLGLTEEEAQEAADNVASGTSVKQPAVDISQMVAKQVEARLDYQEAVSLMPELKKDNQLAAWAAALVDQGMTHVQAVKAMQKKLGTTAQAAKAEGITQGKQEISEKERAQTAPVNVNTNSDAVAKEDLRRRMKSYDKKTQETAMIEWLAQRERARR